MCNKIYAYHRKFNSFFAFLSICVLSILTLAVYLFSPTYISGGIPLIMKKSSEQGIVPRQNAHNKNHLSDAGKLLQYISHNVDLRYDVLSNFGAHIHEIRLQNNGNKPVPPGNSIQWSLYFNDVHLPEHDALRYSKYVELDSSNFVLTHVDGGLFKLTPNSYFTGIDPEDYITIDFSSHTTVSRYYILPRWYVAAPGEDPWIVQNTDADPSTYVSELASEAQQKRSNIDSTGPFTLEKRFEEYFVADMEKAPLRIVPKPVFSDLHKNNLLHIKPSKWSICHQPASFENEIQLLADMYKIPLTSMGAPCPPSNVIVFTKGEVEGVDKSDEAYEVDVKPQKNKILITAYGRPGAFYAIQTLQSLAVSAEGGFTFPAGVVKDAPRFAYRGLHVDVSRNFVQLDDMLTLIETMAMYKLNKLHLHLTDDEGWRVEIPGLPELTQVGAVRRHCEKEHDAIFPALGSGPLDNTSGSGFYSVSDYQKILKVASANHIQVIPEIDVPGHSHAAIRAMEARQRRLKSEGLDQEAEEYLLSDPNDRSAAMSVQHFRNNAINPCMKSTYKFMSHVIGELKKMHEPIQPLTIMHVGGDEVAKNSWAASPVCKQFLNLSRFPRTHKDLQEYFMRQISKICKSEFNVTMAVWEDGALKMPANQPYDKANLNDCDVIAYAWNNDWKKPTAERAYKLANAGYKVVMAHATHLYFDHPQEPDPDENGLTWATRYTDDKKVFDFRPDDLFGNAKIDWNGYFFSDDEIESIRSSRPKIEKPENIIGMQANLWTELVRNSAMMHSQLFPRLLAFAERAWHKADWELNSSRDLRLKRSQDWTNFANVVGYRELPRLKNKGIQFRIPPPGVSFMDGKFQICSLYPGLQYFYRPITDGEASDWTECKSGDPIPDENARYEFVSSDGVRKSRVVK